MNPRNSLRLMGIALVSLGLAMPLLTAAEQPAFTGKWQRNDEQSDDPQEKMREAMEAMQQQMGGRGGGMGGSTGGRGGSTGGRGGGTGGRGGGMGGDTGGRGGGREGRGGREAGLANLMAMTAQIETVLQNNELQVIPMTGEGRVRIFYLDGKKHKQETPNGMKIETKSELKGSRVLVEQKMEQGRKIKTTYELGPDGTRMIVTTKLEGDRMPEPIIIRTVYDSISEEAL